MRGTIYLVRQASRSWGAWTPSPPRDISAAAPPSATAASPPRSPPRAPAPPPLSTAGPLSPPSGTTRSPRSTPSSETAGGDTPPGWPGSCSAASPDRVCSPGWLLAAMVSATRGWFGGSAERPSGFRRRGSNSVAVRCGRYLRRRVRRSRRCTHRTDRYLVRLGETRCPQ